MNLEDKITDIQRYLTNQMTDAEKLNFEAEINTSPELAAEVRSLRELRIVSTNQDLLAAYIGLKQMMHDVPIEPDMDYNIEDDLNPKIEHISRNTGKSNWILRRVGVAAIIGIGIIGYWFYQHKKEEEKKEVAKNIVAESTNKRMSNILGLDSTSSDPKTRHFIEAMNYYDKEQFKEAEQELSFELLRNDNAAQFYLAMCYLYSDDSKKAEEILRGLINKDNFSFQEDAKHYYPIALLANGKIAEAKAYLSNLEKMGHLSDENKKILEKLE